ncbi:MAG: ubiquinone/menaquinone biosynthesis methyltransferase [Blastochloris sp.]|nr:ubiquinone/menaquinone biosynthesis methyltransferase [Blastochloris sp.]
MTGSSGQPVGTPEVENHGRKVRSMFGRIARPYDFLNRFFSLGVDVYWRWVLVRGVTGALRQAGRRVEESLILDLATGSGDVARILSQQGLRVLGSDFCLPMLALAEKKGVENLVAGDALNLPLVDEAVDGATLAFGLRNFGDRAAGLRELRRVLKSGGSLHVLEFTRPVECLCGIYFFYLKHVMPGLAGWFCRDPEAYVYLANTVEAFPRVEEIGRQMEEAGFTEVRWKRLSFGLVAIHTGRRRDGVGGEERAGSSGEGA